MSFPDGRVPAAALILVLILLGPTTTSASQEVQQHPSLSRKGPQLGQPLSREEERALDITILPDGRGLPIGSGDSSKGAELFRAKCESCHGPAGRKGVGQIPALTGGLGTLASPAPSRTVNSYWPFAPMVFDYIRRAMPPSAPNSLTANETYSLTAYLLSVDGTVAKTSRLDQKSLPLVRMPNRQGFIPHS